jgi:hypothetical protein
MGLKKYRTGKQKLPDVPAIDLGVRDAVVPVS